MYSLLANSSQDILLVADNTPLHYSKRYQYLLRDWALTSVRIEILDTLDKFYFYFYQECVC
jgi:hypothetical protein